MGIHHFGAVITFDHRKLRGQKREDERVNENLDGMFRSMKKCFDLNPEPETCDSI